MPWFPNPHLGDAVYWIMIRELQIKSNLIKR